MKLEQHEEDAMEYKKTLAVLRQNDVITRRKLIVEGCVLAGSNLINLALHRLGKLSEEKDMKHNRLEGYLKREQPLPNAEVIASLVRILEELKYKVVHGKSREENHVKQALDTLDAIELEVMKNA